MFGGPGKDDPFREMDGILRRVFNLTGDPLVGGSGHPFGSFGSLGGGGRGGFLSTMSRGSWLPPMNLLEDHSQFVLTTDAAGMKREDMEVSVKENRVCVKGTRRDVEAAVNGSGGSGEGSGDASHGPIYHMYERGFGAFERCVTLPSRIREDSVAAQFNDGVLTVSMAKEDAGSSRGAPISIR
jgi:HSP20 family protein